MTLPISNPRKDRFQDVNLALKPYEKFVFPELIEVGLAGSHDGEVGGLFVIFSII